MHTITLHPSGNAAFPSTWSDKIDALVKASLDTALSGAVVTLAQHGVVLYQKVYGYQRKYNEGQLMPNPEPMTLDTIFDLASLTKIFSTMLAYHRLVEKQLVALSDPVSQYLPGWDTDKKDITIKLLLQHNSGLPSGFPFYDPKHAGALYSQDRNKTIGFLGKVPLAHKPGTQTVYSDLNFVTLGAVLEKVTGATQDKYVEGEIYGPLGLRHTAYKPMERGYPQTAFEATTRFGNTREGHFDFPNVRKDTIQGKVQDETAYYAMQQISGNAGLFSTAAELCVLAQMLLNGGSYGGFTLCSPKTVALFRSTLNIDKTYALGWELPTVNTHLLYGYIPPIYTPNLGDAVGHTGWTGKCVLLDFAHNMIFLLLTNKKHSPLVPVDDYLNFFEGDFTPAGKYGNIADLFYAGVIESGAAALRKAK